MHISKLTSLLLCPLFSRLVLSSNVRCNDQAITAPFIDCKAVIAGLNQEWQKPGENKVRVWSKIVEKSNQTQSVIPCSFKLVNTGHGPQTNKCQFWVDVRADRSPASEDHFNLQTLTLIANRILDQCWVNGKNGVGFPGLENNVFVEPRYRPLVDDELLGSELSESNGTVLVESHDTTDVIPETEVVQANPVDTS